MDIRRPSNQLGALELRAELGKRAGSDEVLGWVGYEGAVVADQEGVASLELFDLTLMLHNANPSR